MTNKCSVCGKSGHNKRYHSNLNVKEKKCNMCLLQKPISEFYKQRKINSGGRKVFYLNHICKKCDNASSRSRVVESIENKISASFRASQSRSKKDNIPFDIDIDYLLELYKKQDGKCFYSKIEMSKERGDYTISIDKKEPNLGYVKGNIVLCCWLINNMKRHLGEDRFINMCKTISANF